MSMHGKTTGYVRGHKGSQAFKIFSKGMVCLLISQIIFFGVPAVFSLLVQNWPEPIRGIVEYLDQNLKVGKVHAAGEVEFVSIIDPDNGAGTDYTSLTSWESSVQVDLTAFTTKVIAGSMTAGSIADGVAITQTTSGATAVAVHAAATQMLVKSIVGTPNGTNTWYPTADGNDSTNAWTPTNAGDPAIAVAKCRSTSSTADITKFTIDGWTTSADSYIKIYTDPAESYRHDGTYNTAKYRMEAASGADFDGVIIIRENYVRIEGLQFQLTNSGGNLSTSAIYMVDQTSPSDILIKNNIMKGVISAANSEGRGIYGNDADITATITNNIIYDFVNSATANNAGIGTALGGTYNIYNNTLVDNFEGIDVDAGTVVAKNNLVTGSGDANAYIGTFAVGTNYNATNGTDAVGQGANNRISQTFTFLNEGSDNFHLAAGDTGAKNQGTDLSGDFTDDIDSTTRSGTWDIGADDDPPVSGPVISSLTVAPSAGILKVGSTITMTIDANATGYTESVITVNSKDVTGFTDVGDTTYTVVYTIAEGDTNVSSGNLTASVVLDDGVNTNTPFTTVGANTVVIDANSPAISSVTGSSIYVANDTITIIFDEPMDTTTITDGIATLVIRYADDISGTNEVIMPTANATVTWSGGNTIATITLDGS